MYLVLSTVSSLYLYPLFYVHLSCIFDQVTIFFFQQYLNALESKGGNRHLIYVSIYMYIYKYMISFEGLRLDECACVHEVFNLFSTSLLFMFIHTPSHLAIARQGGRGSRAEPPSPSVRLLRGCFSCFSQY